MNFEFGDQRVTPGWLQNQNDMISPNSDSFNPVVCKKASFECKLSNNVQTN